MTQPQSAALNVELDGLTIDEIELFEETTGVLIAHVQARPSMRAARGLIWIMRRRTEPTLQFDDLRSMTIEELTAWSERLKSMMAAASGVAPLGPSGSDAPAAS